MFIYMYIYMYIYISIYIYIYPLHPAQHQWGCPTPCVPFVSDFSSSVSMLNDHKTDFFMMSHLLCPPLTPNRLFPPPSNSPLYFHM